MHVLGPLSSLPEVKSVWQSDTLVLKKPGTWEGGPSRTSRTVARSSDSRSLERDLEAFLWSIMSRLPAPEHGRSVCKGEADMTWGQGSAQAHMLLDSPAVPHKQSPGNHTDTDQQTL